MIDQIIFIQRLIKLIHPGGRFEILDPETHEIGFIDQQDKIIARASMLTANNAPIEEDILSIWQDLLRTIVIGVRRTKVEEEINSEFVRAMSIHPKWKHNLMWRIGVITEEVGELAKAGVQYEDEGGSFVKIREEAIHVAAVTLRFLEELEGLRKWNKA